MILRSRRVSIGSRSACSRITARRSRRCSQRRPRPLRRLRFRLRQATRIRPIRLRMTLTASPGCRVIFRSPMWVEEQAPRTRGRQVRTAMRRCCLLPAITAMTIWSHISERVFRSLYIRQRAMSVPVHSLSSSFRMRETSLRSAVSCSTGLRAMTASRCRCDTLAIIIRR